MQPIPANIYTTLPNYVNVILFAGPDRPKAKRKVSFGHVVGLGTIEKTVPREESPCYDDKKLQIFSFVSLFIHPWNPTNSETEFSNSDLYYFFSELIMYNRKKPSTFLTAKAYENGIADFRIGCWIP